MIDKKVVALIGVLVVAALVIIVVSTANLNFSGNGGSSFTALMDKMQETEPGSLALVLPSTYLNNQEVTITDKIISMSSTDYGTTFYFVYSGTLWVNESSGTSFDVMTYQGEDLQVRNAMFHVHVSGDLHALYDIGDLITLRTTVRISSGDAVLSGTWVVIGH